MDVRSWKVPIGRVLRRTSRKRLSIALVVLTFLRSARGRVSEAGEQIVEVVSQAGDGLGVGLLPGVGEAARGAESLGPVWGVQDGVEVGLDSIPVGLSHLVEDVPDLVRPAALQGDAGIDRGQGGDQALAAVGTDHLDPVSGEPTTVEIGEELLPRGGALAGGEAEVDDLLLAVGADAERHQDRALQRAGRRSSSPAPRRRA